MLRFSVPTKTPLTSAIIQVSLLVIRLVIPVASLSRASFEVETAAESSFTRVHVTSASIENSQTPYPIEVNCSIAIEGQEIMLKLVENKQLQIGTPIFYLNENHDIVSLTEPDKKFKDTKFYQEANGKAAVALTPRKTQGKEWETHDMDGLIFHKGSTYRISKIHANSNGTIHGSGLNHEVKKLRRPKGTTDYIHTSRGDQQNMKTKPHTVHSRYRRGVPAYEVDLLYVLDFSTFQSFLSKMKIFNPNVTTTAVLHELRYYYAQVSNGVDIRYRGIKTAPWTISTKLVAFYIVTVAAESNWTEIIRIPGGQNGHDALSALDGLEGLSKWAYGTTKAAIISSLPTFNHAMMFTAYDIFGGNSTDRNYDVIGVAYLRALCTSNSASIIENTGALTEAETAAHELGHSLGAQHDGVGNNCSASSSYIMTAVLSTATNATVENYYLFSSCSIDYFTKYIASLSLDYVFFRNCMTGTGNYFNESEWQAIIARPPGQVYTPNDLCHQAYGPSFEVCGGVNYGSRVCMSIYCHNTSESDLFWTCQAISAGGRGLDGMSCGNKRWCDSGICVYNSSAPAALDTCPLGDWSETEKVYSDMPYICSNMPSSYCYDQRVFNRCCSTCSNLMDATLPGCPFGDKTDCSSVTAASCPLNLNICCRTCNASSTTIQTTKDTTTVTSLTQPTIAIDNTHLSTAGSKTTLSSFISKSQTNLALTEITQSTDLTTKKAQTTLSDTITSQVMQSGAATRQATLSTNSTTKLTTANNDTIQPSLTQAPQQNFVNTDAITNPATSSVPKILLSVPRIVIIIAAMLVLPFFYF